MNEEQTSVVVQRCSIASGRQYGASVLIQWPSHLEWIAGKPPSFEALRRVQVEHVPGQIVALAEWNQCQSLGWIEATNIEFLQVIECFFKFDVGLIELPGRHCPQDQGLSIGSTRAGVQSLNLRADRLDMQPMVPQRSDNGA